MLLLRIESRLASKHPWLADIFMGGWLGRSELFIKSQTRFGVFQGRWLVSLAIRSPLTPLPREAACVRIGWNGPGAFSIVLGSMIDWLETRASVLSRVRSRFFPPQARIKCFARIFEIFFNLEWNSVFSRLTHRPTALKSQKHSALHGHGLAFLFRTSFWRTFCF